MDSKFFLIYLLVHTGFDIPITAQTQNRSRSGFVDYAGVPGFEPESTLLESVMLAIAPHPQTMPKTTRLFSFFLAFCVQCAANAMLTEFF